MILNFKELCSKYNCIIKGVLHIGAHFGEEHNLYKENNISNIIYFEPVKSTFEVLKNRVGADAILVNKAIGNDNKRVIINTDTNEKGSSSILNPKLHLEQYPWIHFNSKEEVEMIRLDDFDFDKTKYNLINIDIQGYELEAFRGAENTLSNIDYIISEVNRAEVYENCPHIMEICKFLDKFNFKLKEVNWAGETWGDAFFIKHE